MHRIIVLAFSTLDGITQDPDGSEGTPHGGWMFRHGPDAVTGDKFKLGPLLATGVLLLGRKTWQSFARIWPSRSDDFSVAMTRIPKLVASRSRPDLSSYANSSFMTGDLFETVEQQKAERDVIVTGSHSLVAALAQRDYVDEYRIVILPSVLGKGTRLFDPEAPPRDWRLASAESRGAGVLLRYERAGGLLPGF